MKDNFKNQNHLLMKRMNFLGMTLIVLFIGLFQISCDKEPALCDGEIGEFQDFTGLDGCGFLFVLDDDGSKLENVNLALYNIEIGKKYCITYVERSDLGSYCMVGKVVEILTLKEF